LTVLNAGGQDMDDCGSRGLMGIYIYIAENKRFTNKLGQKLKKMLMFLVLFMYRPRKH
jgi:hypothetical protein